METTMTPSRLAKLPAALLGGNLDALILNAGPSLVYLTGLHFHLSERPVAALFTADQDPVIILPELEMLKLTGMLVKAYPYGENPADWGDVFHAAVQSLELD